MIRKIYLVLLVVLAVNVGTKAQMMSEGLSGGSLAQPQPFLYTLNSLSPGARHWSLNYSGGYGQYTVSPLGFDGVDQDIAVKGYLGNQFSLMTTLGVGFGNGGNTQTYQQAEVFKDFIGGKSATGFRFGTSLGIIHEFSNDVVALSRFNAAYESLTWKVGANARVEKAFAKDRDALDLISSFGIQRKITGRLFGGVEAVGQDLEGLWETDEAEGGAKVLIGPSLNFCSGGFAFIVFVMCRANFIRYA